MLTDVTDMVMDAMQLVHGVLLYWLQTAGCQKSRLQFQAVVTVQLPRDTEAAEEVGQ